MGCSHSEGEVVVRYLYGHLCGGGVVVLVNEKVACNANVILEGRWPLLLFPRLAVRDQSLHNGQHNEMW
ncbi:hypothetical protein GQ54DRAFT_200825 [Martensiomyces pterosporus]|nr:hypothetical protein GQ54DRAFT_200825 [Martensiomyces pterosporus]